MNKPQIGTLRLVGGNPCNKHLMDLWPRGACQAFVWFRPIYHGGLGGISMGRWPSILQSPTIAGLHSWMGGVVHANICSLAATRTCPAAHRDGALNGLMVYGSTIKPGMAGNGEPLDIVSAFQSYGQFVTDAIDEAERSEIVGVVPSPARAAACTPPTPWPPPSGRSACPTLLFLHPAEDPLKMDECFMAGKAIKHMLESTSSPATSLTRAAAFERHGDHHRARRVHQRRAAPDRAHAVGSYAHLDDFQAVSDKTPFIADLKPSGSVMEDAQIGGTPGVLKVRLGSDRVSLPARFRVCRPFFGFVVRTFLPRHARERKDETIGFPFNSLRAMR